MEVNIVHAGCQLRPGRRPWFVDEAAIRIARQVWQQHIYLASTLEPDTERRESSLRTERQPVWDEYLGPAGGRRGHACAHVVIRLRGWNSIDTDHLRPDG